MRENTSGRAHRRPQRHSIDCLCYALWDIDFLFIAPNRADSIIRPAAKQGQLACKVRESGGRPVPNPPGFIVLKCQTRRPIDVPHYTQQENLHYRTRRDARNSCMRSQRVDGRVISQFFAIVFCIADGTQQCLGLRLLHFGSSTNKKA